MAEKGTKITKHKPTQEELAARDVNKVKDPFTGQVFGEPVEPKKKEKDPEDKDLVLKLIDVMSDTSDIQIKTEVNENQIIANSLAVAYAKAYNVPFVSEMVFEVSKWYISKGRKWRKEIERIATASNINAQEDLPEMQRIRSRLLGK